MTDTHTQSHETDDEFDAILRQMFDEHPAPAAPVDLARRARRLATHVSRAELARLERIRRWAFGVTMAAAMVIFYLAARLILDTLSHSGFYPNSSNFSSTSMWSSGTQLLVIIAATGAAVAMGLLLVGPALSIGEQ